MISVKFSIPLTSRVYNPQLHVLFEFLTTLYTELLQFFQVTKFVGLLKKKTFVL